MNQLEKKLPDINQGWVVHIYGSNRRLLCSIDPSHCWSMIAGLAMGIILTATYMEHTPSTPQIAPNTKSIEAPLSVD